MLEIAGAAETAREVVSLVLDHVERTKLEFSTFLVGVQLEIGEPGPLDEREIWSKEVKRQAGIALADLWAPRDVAFRRPDVVFVFHPYTRTLEARVAPVLVYGRYVKLARDISQTRWRCPRCRGRGCPNCGMRGRIQTTSVEELIGSPLEALFEAKGFVLHGMGREDVDVRTLAPGRPFVVELREPRRRSVDLARAALSVKEHSRGVLDLGCDLRYAKPDVIARLKELEPAKRYHAIARAAGPIDPLRVASLGASLTGVTISQKTPRRVMERRGDIVRARRVLSLEASLRDPTTLELSLLTEAGTYIKELVSSDDGRTTPSVTELLGVQVIVSELDVVEVLARDEDLLGDQPSPTPGTSLPSSGLT